MCTRQVLMNPLRCTDELNGIIIMLLHTGSYGKYVRVEDDIERIHTQLVYQKMISTFCYLDAALESGSLTNLIKTHHNNGCTIAQHIAGMRKEYFLALLQTDGIDNTLALAALQASHDDVPFGRVDHHRNLRNVWFSSNHIQEINHLGFRIEQTIVHIHVNDSCSISHLLSGNTDGFFIILFVNQTQELPAAGYVTAFAHVDKPTGVNRQMYGIIDLQKI